MTSYQDLRFQCFALIKQTLGFLAFPTRFWMLQWFARESGSRLNWESSFLMDHRRFAHYAAIKRNFTSFLPRRDSFDLQNFPLWFDWLLLVLRSWRTRLSRRQGPGPNQTVRSAARDYLITNHRTSHCRKSLAAHSPAHLHCFRIWPSISRSLTSTDRSIGKVRRGASRAD